MPDIILLSTRRNGEPGGINSLTQFTSKHARGLSLFSYNTKEVFPLQSYINPKLWCVVVNCRLIG